MVSRLDDVLRAGQAAATGTRGRELWNGIAGNLTEIVDGQKTNDPTTPGMQRALAVAGEHEAREAELRARNRAAERAKQEEHERMVQEAARTREFMKKEQARREEREFQEQRRVRAYNSGNADMRWIILQAQLPVFTKMHERLRTIGDNLTDELDTLLGQESTPLSEAKIMRLQDNLKELEELTVGVQMLKSSVEDAEAYDFDDARRNSLF